MIHGTNQETSCVTTSVSQFKLRLKADVHMSTCSCQFCSPKSCLLELYINYQDYIAKLRDYSVIYIPEDKAVVQIRGYVAL